MRLALLVLVAAATTLPAQRGAVAGRVVDSAGAPLAHFEARAVGSAVGTAGDSGYFSVEVDDRSAARIELRARGHATAIVAVTGHANVGTIALPRGAPIIGRVLDTGGRPVSGVEVRAVDALADLPYFAQPEDPEVCFQARSVSGPDGTFRIDGGLTSGARVVAIAAPGIESAVEPVDAGEPVTLVVPSVRTVRGTVVDDAGRPIERATTYLEREGRWVVGVRTDAAGRFELVVPAERGQAITAFVTRGSSRTAAPFAELPGDGGVDGLTLELPGEGMCTLRIEAADDIAAFTVGHVFQDSDSPQLRPGYLDAALAQHPWVAHRGRVEIPFVPEGTPFVAEVRAPGRGRTRVTGLVDGDRVIRVDLPREAIVRGHVVDASTGAPLRGIRLAVESVSAEVGAVFAAMSDVQRGAGTRPVEATSNTDGSFELRELAPGRWHILAMSGPGTAPARSEVVLREAEVIEGLKIRVDVGGTVRGRITGARSGVGVRVVRGDVAGWERVATTVVDSDGIFEMQRVPRGSARLELLVPQPARLGAPRGVLLREIEVGDSPTEVAVELSGVLRTVRGELRVAGAPPPRGRLAVFLEPAVATSGPRDRRSLWLEGAASFVDSSGHFSMVADLGEHVPLVLDIATGVVLERLDAVTVHRGAAPLDLGEITVSCVRARVRIDGPESALRYAERIEVDVGALFPNGVGRMAMDTPVTHFWDCGVGVALGRDQRSVEIFLPVTGARLSLRGDRYGQPQQNVLATADVDPRDHTRIEVGLVVESK